MRELKRNFLLQKSRWIQALRRKGKKWKREESKIVPKNFTFVYLPFQFFAKFDKTFDYNKLPLLVHVSFNPYSYCFYALFPHPIFAFFESNPCLLGLKKRSFEENERKERKTSLFGECFYDEPSNICILCVLGKRNHFHD